MGLEKKIYKFPLFCCHLPLEKGRALNLNKHESTLPKDALCQVWLKLVEWFSRRRFSNFVYIFLLFRYFLPLKKSRALHLNKHVCPSPKHALCQVWLKLAQWFWRGFLNIFYRNLLFRCYFPL